jgi:hypothetical protein
MSDKKAQPSGKEPQAEKKTDKTGQLPDDALDKARGGSTESVARPIEERKRIP